MAEITKYGLVGVIALLLGFGGSIALTNDELDRAYVCNITEKVALFERLSSTGKTGYYADNSLVCTNGHWIPLREYAASKGVSIEEILAREAALPSGNVGISYSCSPQGCERMR